MDKLLDLFQPVARRALRSVKDTLLYVIELYRPLSPDSEGQTRSPTPQDSWSASPEPSSTSPPSTPISIMGFPTRDPGISAMDGYNSISPLPRSRSALSLPTRNPKMSVMYAASLEPRTRTHTPVSFSCSKESLTTSIIGSEYIMPTKTRVSSNSRAKVIADLAEAMGEHFLKPWPLLEEATPIQSNPLRQNQRIPLSKQRKSKSGKEMEESGLFVKTLSGGEKVSREEIMKKWMAKDERSITNRRRVPGGFEDTVDNEGVESMWGMRPTLDKYRDREAPVKTYFKKRQGGSIKDAERRVGRTEENSRDRAHDRPNRKMGEVRGLDNEGGRTSRNSLQSRHNK